LSDLYLTPARSRLFGALPELEWPKTFLVMRARAIVARIQAAARRALVAQKLETLLRTRLACEP
jgi:hypothetical protein